MSLRRLVFSLAGLAVPAALAFLTSCAKDVVRLDRNRPPQTFIVAAPLDSAGIGGENTKASYRVHLYWRGEDSDGYVVGFLWSFDDSSLGTVHYTTKTDSVFELLVNDSTAFTGEQNPSTSRYHSFFIRAVDNLGKMDPNITVFNRRTFLAQTLKPRVGFLGAPPSHRKFLVPGEFPGEIDTIEVPDTLADGAAFQVAWTGFDPDNPPTFGVPLYKFKVGTYESGISSDTIAYFNDPSNPRSVGLASGLYTMTVTAFDVARAVGDSQFTFVVNYDPQTWFMPRDAPIGYYIQPFREGSALPPTDTPFYPGDTIPYRSTVWWEWDSSDNTAGETDCISGWSLFLTGGSRNNGQPYTTGFRHDLGPTRPDILFKTNNPKVVGPAGFVDLILDSLDAGPIIQIFARSRDCSGRVDGTPAIFPLKCNFSPELRGVWYSDTCAINTDIGSGQPQPGIFVFWDTYDYEDGKTTFTRLRVDGTRNLDLRDREHGYFIPTSVFKGLSPGSNEGFVVVTVQDRAAQYQSNDPITIRFPLPDSTVCTFP